MPGLAHRLPLIASLSVVSGPLALRYRRCSCNSRFHFCAVLSFYFFHYACCSAGALSISC